MEVVINDCIVEINELPDIISFKNKTYQEIVNLKEEHLSTIMISENHQVARPRRFLHTSLVKRGSSVFPSRAGIVENGCGQLEPRMRRVTPETGS